LYLTFPLPIGFTTRSASSRINSGIGDQLV
jgi:hypothetical protein